MNANWRRGARKRTELDPPPAQRLLNALDRSERGEVDAWLLVVRELTLKDDGANYGNFYEASTLTMPGWIRSDESARKRIVDAAKRYLEFSPFFNSVWSDGGAVPRGAFAAAQALWVCLQSDSTFVKNRADLAQKCVQSVGRFHATTRESTFIKQELLRQLVISQESAVRDAIVGEICRDNEQHGYYLAADSVGAVWNSTLGLELVELLRSGKLKPAVTVSLLIHLFELSPESARSFASSKLGPPACNQPLDEAARAVALAWMKGDPVSAWNIVWPLMQKDNGFGDYLISQLGSTLLDQPRFLSVVDVATLADFYLWMVNRFPYPENDADESTGPRPVVFQHYLRDNALEHLKQRGTFAAVAEIQRVMDELPQYGWLRLHLDEADRVARALTWRPFSIKELGSVLGNPALRLVGSEQDLLEVLCESLERLQLQLRGETPTAHFLWNTDPAVKAKGEEDLSDFLTNHLRSDIGSRGVVVNREVQIRRSNRGGVSGQRTDIHVSAVSPSSGGAQTVSVIIEVKACWNPEVLVAMETQLRDRYLKDNATRTGLYVVGWYASPAWDRNDARGKRRGDLKLHELRSKLAEQARELTGAARLKSVTIDCSLD